MDLTALTNRMQRCTLCPDLPLGPRPIFQLDPRARILIAGQAPGRITHAKGRPFDDPSGDRLRDWLGVDRDMFYDASCFAMLPMAFCFPGSGKGGDAPPPALCATTWRAQALDALRNIALTLVLGRYAIMWHRPDLRSLSVTQAVQQTAQEAGSLFVMPHPSPRNNRWLRDNAWFETEHIPALRRRVAQVFENRSATF